MSSLHVLCKVADGLYAVPANQVLQMETFTGATRVPGAQPHVAGLVQIRSRVIPVVDLRMRFGLPTIEPTLDSRVMVVQCDARTVGLLADSVREVLMIDPAAFKAPPDILKQQAAGFVEAVAQLGDRIIMLMDSKKVIGEEVLHGDEASA
ncbi:MAG TPA: chemotaxis protein CheW [Polyangiales bacterium]